MRHRRGRRTTTSTQPGPTDARTCCPAQWREPRVRRSDGSPWTTAASTLVEDLDTGRALCLEANAAPGMSQDTVRALYAQVQQTLRAPQRRAG